MKGLALVDTRHEYFGLFDIYVPIAIAVFAVVVLVIVTAVVRFRGRLPSEAARWHENNRLEGAYAAFLTAIVAFLLYLTFTAEHKVDTVANDERPAVTIDVTGAKWEWLFRYPGYGITQRSGTVGRQPLVVPHGEAVRFNLTSADVIHSLWIPEVEFKHDVFPGTLQHITLAFTHSGVFEGQCSQFCGLRHADMVFDVDVVSPSRFRAWAHSGGRAAP